MGIFDTVLNAFIKNDKVLSTDNKKGNVQISALPFLLQGLQMIARLAKIATDRRNMIKFAINSDGQLF